MNKRLEITDLIYDRTVEAHKSLKQWVDADITLLCQNAEQYQSGANAQQARRARSKSNERSPKLST